ncbi:MAG: hypothetical protein ACR2H3_12240 [Acidimicrobiales bacterium]
MLIDIARFRLAEGVDESAFLSADEAVQTQAIPNLAGFARRTTARAEREWVVITHWFDLAAAVDGTAAVDEHPAGVAFAACIDPGAWTWQRYETLD